MTKKILGVSALFATLGLAACSTSSTTVLEDVDTSDTNTTTTSEKLAPVNTSLESEATVAFEASAVPAFQPVDTTVFGNQPTPVQISVRGSAVLPQNGLLQAALPGVCVVSYFNTPEGGVSSLDAVASGSGSTLGYGAKNNAGQVVFTTVQCGSGASANVKVNFNVAGKKYAVATPAKG